MVVFVICIGFCLVLSLALWRLRRFNRRFLEPIFMWIAVFGILALCQPFFLALYNYGFAILLTGALGFIVAQHLKPVPEDAEDAEEIAEEAEEGERQ